MIDENYFESSVESQENLVEDLPAAGSGDPVPGDPSGGDRLLGSSESGEGFPGIDESVDSGDHEPSLPGQDHYDTYVSGSAVDLSEHVTEALLVIQENQEAALQVMLSIQFLLTCTVFFLLFSFAEAKIKNAVINFSGGRRK